MLTLIDWNTFKEVFELIKFFSDFTTWIEDYNKTRLYRVFWEVLPLIYKLIKEYERYLTHYTALAISN